MRIRSNQESSRGPSLPWVSCCSKSRTVAACAARYSLLGGTSPTAYDGETLRVGSLLDASLTVNFSSQRVSGQISTSFIVDGESHAVLVYNVAGLDGAAFRSDGCGNGFFNGFFTGNQASRAGLVYGAYDSTVGDVRRGARAG